MRVKKTPTAQRGKAPVHPKASTRCAFFRQMAYDYRRKGIYSIA